ncbi:MAG: threonine aldolase family protein [Clostridia bacterium]
MLYFESDYMEGAHPEVLRRLSETNMEHLSSYGNDKYCESAKEKIRAACRCPDAGIFFLAGGTQTNAVVIDSVLTSYQGVIAADTGHINGHEAGAVEFTGHKVMAIPNYSGKISAEDLANYLRDFWQDGNHEHMVFPGMVYISHPTEYGTLYTAEELRKIHEVCGEYKIPLFLDGARLGYGLAADTDVTLPLIAEYCDVFYIGGTKVGALCGEAVVFTKNYPSHFLTTVKQHGALLAKGRLLGVQFDALFSDDLYFKISKNAIEKAMKLKKGLKEKGYEFYIDSLTNQQFIVLENGFMEKLKEKVRFGFWEKADENHTVVRFATSWATSDEDVTALLEVL